MRRTSRFLLLLALAFGHLGATASYTQETQPRQDDASKRPGFTFKRNLPEGVKVLRDLEYPMRTEQGNNQESRQ
ncbi:MAG: hypothetical protein ACYC6Y_09740 [Thermoguttaceae bacterium]